MANGTWILVLNKIKQRGVSERRVGKLEIRTENPQWQKRLSWLWTGDLPKTFYNRRGQGKDVKRMKKTWRKRVESGIAAGKKNCQTGCGW